MNIENCHEFVTLLLHSRRSLQNGLCNVGGDEAQSGKTAVERLGEGKDEEAERESGGSEKLGAPERRKHGIRIDVCQHERKSRGMS
ncbi:hypothetical protein L2449_06685 [Mesorhizobium muleiense]|uniref:hypothetical protein n=1 Tax=Mesorhizobium muleiense TaxID=1004279 RepID=UPI001F42D7BD|nr:hypothetical protein [Mesorhizobium muleiense]MCF6116605.1 hypothetical protein [Mesorhizobium muleiense]